MLDKENMKNLYMHLTNVAIQKRNDAYDENTGMKWAIRNLKLYLNSKVGPAATLQLLGEIQVGSGSCCVPSDLEHCCGQLWQRLQPCSPQCWCFKLSPTASRDMLPGMASTFDHCCFRPAASSSVRCAMFNVPPAAACLLCSASDASCRPLSCDLY